MNERYVVREVVVQIKGGARSAGVEDGYLDLWRHGSECLGYGLSFAYRDCDGLIGGSVRR